MESQARTCISLSYRGLRDTKKKATFPIGLTIIRHFKATRILLDIRFTSKIKNKYGKQNAYFSLVLSTVKETQYVQ